MNTLTQDRPPETAKYVRVMALGTEAPAVRRARCETSAACAAWGLGHLAADAVLIASEMSTNALQATWEARAFLPVLMRLRSDGESPIVEIWDAAIQKAPRVCQHAPDAIGGRGLEIVERLSDSWGCYRQRNGKIVWSVISGR